MIDDFDRIARLDLDLEKYTTPDWEFGGFHFPYTLVRDTYQAYKDHGVLLVAGGYLDQPPQWWADMQTCQAIYNTRLIVNIPEAEKKAKDKHGTAS